jgi:hypothetical protein
VGLITLLSVCKWIHVLVTIEDFHEIDPSSLFVQPPDPNENNGSTISIRTANVARRNELRAFPVVASLSNNNMDTTSAILLQGMLDNHRLHALDSSFFTTPDYNDLIMSFSSSNTTEYFGKSIRSDDGSINTKDRQKFLDAMQRAAEGMKETFYQFEEFDFPRECVRPAWTDKQYPTCNKFHEIDLVTNAEERKTQFWDIQYLSKGYSRSAFLLTNPVTNESIVLKALLYGLFVEHGSISGARKESLILERLTSSTQIINAYGYCSTSVFVEAAQDIEAEILPMSEYQTQVGRLSADNLTLWESQSHHPIIPLNNLTASQKLDYAIQMAESLADLHKLAVINDDVLPRQWLKTHENNIKLGDMNFAIFLPWNPVKREYCPSSYNPKGGLLRAPEEFESGNTVDIRADIYPFGGVIHSLLTGLYPFYEIPSNHRAYLEDKALNNVKPYIDDKFIDQSNTIEPRLVQIMNKCLEAEKDKRPDIFQVLQFLHETKDMNNYQNMR